MASAPSSAGARIPRTHPSRIPRTRPSHVRARTLPPSRAPFLLPAADPAGPLGTRRPRRRRRVRVRCMRPPQRALTSFCRTVPRLAELCTSSSVQPCHGLTAKLPSVHAMGCSPSSRLTVSCGLTAPLWRRERARTPPPHPHPTPPSGASSDSRLGRWGPVRCPSPRSYAGARAP